ncbi:hypothetical protein GCM10023074_36190 [Microbispora amethystogenes]
MPPATADDYAWQSDWEDIYTVTFVRGHDERETLRRFGIAQADMCQRTPDSDPQRFREL